MISHKDRMLMTLRIFEALLRSDQTRGTNTEATMVLSKMLYDQMTVPVRRYRKKAQA